MTERQIKNNLNRLVMHVPSGAVYQLIGATVHRQGITGHFWYQAELQDLNAEHSVLICRLEDIEIIKD